MQVNIGVLEANPSSTEGVSRIMRFLHKYVPTKDGEVSPIVCHGDGLSVERMCDSQRHNAGGSTPTERLEGLVAAPQEFHKRMILLQVRP